MLFQIFAVILFLYFIFKYFFNDDSDSEYNLPPGPKPLPLLGNLIELSKYRKTEKTGYKVLSKLNEKYGPIVRIKAGLCNQVIVGDFEIVKQIMSSDIWIERYFDKWWAERSFGKVLGILLISGETWKEMRRFTLRTLRDFGFGRLKSMESFLEEETKDVIEDFHKKIKENNGRVQIKYMFTISVLNILWSMMSGERYSHDDLRLKELIRLMDQMMRSNPAGVNYYQWFPFLWNLIPLSLSKKRQNWRSQFKGILGFLQDRISERRERGTFMQEQRDFMDVFLNEVETLKAEGSPLSRLYNDEQLLVICLDLFVAGSETTSNSLEYGFLYMTLNPKVQSKVQEEIDRVIGKDRLPSPFDKAKMPYTEATLMELQRIANVAPIISRSPIHTTKLGDYDIPKGYVGLMNLYQCHMDTKYWDNPEEFRPERFLDSEMNVINQHKIIPFGLGKRMCLGESLARTSLFTYFVTMLQNFTFNKIPGYEYSTEGCDGMTVAPQAFEAIVKPR